MNSLKIVASGLSKSYNGIDFVFQNISFEIHNGSVFGIFGLNGSGKSTLLKILAKILIPTEGKVSVFCNTSDCIPEKQRLIQGLVAPYLVLFEEFNPLEHIEINSRILGKKYRKEFAEELIEEFGLTKAVGKHIKEFSSGMKQRMKYILALLFEPEILFLDEPFTNLDENGIQRVEDFIREYQTNGKIVVIATNDKREASFCNRSIRLGELLADEVDLNSTI
jgi:heme exporter protein A